jgi:Tol biopolymer transport system component
MAIANGHAVRRLHPLFVALALAGGSEVHADRLSSAREVVRGDYLAPRFSPDGSELLLTGPKLRGLYLTAVSGGAPRLLTNDPGAGVEARFVTSGVVAYQAIRAGARRSLLVDRDGRVRRAASAAAPIAFTRDDRMYVADVAGQLSPIGSGDRFFGAVIAPDRDKVAFQGLVTGLYVYQRSTRQLVHVGPGTAPAWSPDSSRLVFEVTEDDGHDVVASDLYVYRVATDRVERLTATESVRERRPAFSPDGRELAFDDDRGGVFLARLEVSR